jgi:hypothetical protein
MHFLKFRPNDVNTPDKEAKDKVKFTLEQAMKPVGSRYTDCAIPAPKHSSYLYSNTQFFFWGRPIVEFHLSGLIGTARHPEMQKMRIIGFFFENRLHWQFEVGKQIVRTSILGYILVYVKIKHYSGDDRQLSLLSRFLGIPCTLWEHFGLLLLAVSTCV